MIVVLRGRVLGETRCTARTSGCGPDSGWPPPDRTRRSRWPSRSGHRRGRRRYPPTDRTATSARRCPTAVCPTASRPPAAAAYRSGCGWPRRNRSRRRRSQRAAGVAVDERHQHLWVAGQGLVGGQRRLAGVLQGQEQLIDQRVGAVAAIDQALVVQRHLQHVWQREVARLGWQGHGELGVHLRRYVAGQVLRCERDREGGRGRCRGQRGRDREGQAGLRGPG